MAFYDTIRGLYKSIREVHRNWNTEQIRAEVERYLSGALAPAISGEELYDFFNDSQRNAEGLMPHDLPHYSSSERRERRERANVIRRSIFDLFASRDRALYEGIYKLDDGGVDPNAPGLSKEQQRAIEAAARAYGNRMEAWLFYFLPPTASAQEREAQERDNREVAFLFDTNAAHWEQYYSENVALLKRSGDPAFEQLTEAEIRSQLEESIRERRGQIVMRRARMAGALIERMEAMSDPSLPAEELAANYYLLMQGQAMCMEALAFLDKAEKENRYLLSDADKEYLRYLDKNMVPISNAAVRISSYANPICEFVDPAELYVFDCDGLGDAYMAEYDNAAAQARLQSKHTHYEQYVRNGAKNQVFSLLSDVQKTVHDATFELTDTFPNALEEYGFTRELGGAVLRCEEYDPQAGFRWKQNAGVQELIYGRPIVVEQNGRVAVLSTRYPCGCELTWDKPERLFNFSLRRCNEVLCRQLGDSDQWYQTRSKKFRDMRRFFEELAHSAGELDDTAGSRSQMQSDYVELRRLCMSYLATKPENGIGKNELEQGHIDVAKALQNYAEMKLEELNTVQRAREALAMYHGMTGAEIKASIARKMKYRIDPERRAAVGHWVGDRRDAYLAANLPESVGTVIADSSLVVIRNMAIDPKLQGQQILSSTPATHENVNWMVGAMIAAELIQKEREALRGREGNEIGRLEQCFAEGTFGTQELTALGEAAAREVAGKPVSQMDSRELTDYVAAFPAEGLARELQAAADLKQAAETILQRREDVGTVRSAMQYYSKNGFGVLGSFAEEKILSPMETLSADIGNGNTTADLAASRELMKNCILYSMICELKDDNSAKLLSVLRNPQKTEQLKGAMDGQEVFQNLMRPLEAAAQDGRVPAAEVVSAFRMMKPQRAAFGILQDAKFENAIQAGGEGTALKVPQKNPAIKGPGIGQ